MQVINGTIALIGRAMISVLFIAAGLGKVTDIGGTASYMASAGLPSTLAWPGAIFELGLGLTLLLGIFTRISALLLAVFCVITALIFHTNFADPTQMANFLKNFAIAGGLLVLTAYNGTWYSWDAMRKKRREELDARKTVVVEKPVAVETTSVKK